MSSTDSPSFAAVAIKQEFGSVLHQAPSQQSQHYVPPVRSLGGPAPSAGFSRPSHLAEAQQRGGVCPPQRPNSGDANTTITQFLMNYVVGSDRDFSKKAIESLIKKLKDKRNELDDFIMTVSTMGQMRTKCITTPRTLDGRLQVAGRKGFPHVVYAKIFRWPDLHKNELKHKQFCICAFDLKVEQVCVNPYHYERVLSADGVDLDSNNSSSVDQANSAEIVSPAVGASRAVAGQPAAFTTRGPGRPPNALRQQLQQPQQPQQQQFVRNSVPSHQKFVTPSVVSSSSSSYRPMTTTAAQPQHFQAVQQPQPFSSSSPCGPSVSATSQMSPQMASVSIGQSPSHHPSSYVGHAQHPFYAHPYQQQQLTTAPPLSVQMQMTNAFGALATISGSNNLPLGNGQQHFYNSHNAHPSTSYPPNSSHQPVDSIPPLFLLSDSAVAHPPPSPKYIVGIAELMMTHNANVPLLSDKPMPLQWCSATYYEFDRKVGETFQAAAEYPQIFVDGGMDTLDATRFCLGSLTNTDRVKEAEKCRRNIRTGIRLDLKGEGDVWLTTFTKEPVFVQSHYLDVLAEREEEPGQAHRFEQYTTVKIFDLLKCFECWKRTNLERVMARRVKHESRVRRARLDNHHQPGVGGSTSSAQQQSNAQPNTGIGREDSDDETTIDDPGVDDFRSLCTLRISFFKGFGLSYPKKIIQETPCWIELHLNRALQLLDEVMNTPVDDVLSTLH